MQVTVRNPLREIMSSCNFQEYIIALSIEPITVFTFYIIYFYLESCINLLYQPYNNLGNNFKLSEQFEEQINIF